MQIFTLNVLRYLLFAGGAFFFFYICKREKYYRIKIQSRYPGSENIWREIKYSLLSLGIFACAGGLTFWLANNGHTLIYRDFHAHSAAYFIFSVLVFIVLHDTYFYWAHRLMHVGVIYKYVHRIHHLSTNPTPWAAFAFHPLEAVVEVGILFIMIWLMPLHPLAILAWLLYMTALNVMGHVGYEVFPSGFTTSVFTRWHNSSVHHNMHHRYVRCNYGLYFNIWDRMLGTNHTHYTEEFEAVKARKGSSAESSQLTSQAQQMSEILD